MNIKNQNQESKSNLRTKNENRNPKSDFKIENRKWNFDNVMAYLVTNDLVMPALVRLAKEAQVESNRKDYYLMNCRSTLGVIEKLSISPTIKGLSHDTLEETK